MIPNIKPQFQWVDKKFPQIPRDGEGGYQRPIYQAAGNIDKERRSGGGNLVARIKREFSWTLFGALTLVRRPDGQLIVLDGGHRMEGIRHLDSVNEIPCLIYAVSTVEEEAEIFRAINKLRTSLAASDDHRAAVVQRDEIALKIEGVLQKIGRQAVAGSRNNRVGQVLGCIRAVRAAVRQNEEIALSVLEFLGEVCVGKPLDQYIFGAFVHAETKLRDRKTPLSLTGVYRQAVLDTGYDVIAREIRREISKSETRDSRSPLWARGAVNAINRFSKAGIMLDPPGRPRQAKLPAKAVEIRSQIGRRHNGGAHAAA